jgi:hypothetical protein
LSNRT